MNRVFERLDLRNHDVARVADLIYDVDPFLTRLEFGRRQAGVSRIRRLIEAGSDPFRPGYGFVATEDTTIAGVAFGVSGRELAGTRKTGAGTLYRCVGPGGIVRLAVAWTITSRLLTGRLEEDDFYIMVLSVDPALQGRGVGGFLLDSVVRAARERGCRRAILDVSAENGDAIRFYERHGFRRAGYKRLVPLWDKVGTFTMVLAL